MTISQQANTHCFDHLMIYQEHLIVLVLCQQGTQARDQLAEDACVFAIHAVSAMYWHVALPQMFYLVQLQTCTTPKPQP